MVGGALMGFFGAGMWGMVPTYLSERFPTEARGVGSGFSYHAGAAVGSFAPTTIGWLQDIGWPLPSAMALCIFASLGVVVVMLWLGPETRGRQLTTVAAR
jgi:MFS family permease